MKPFPFAIWPQTFRKGSLKTTNFLEEASRPLPDGRGILSDIFLKKDNKGNTIFPSVSSVDDRISTFKSAAIAPVIIPDSLRSFLRQKKYNEDAFDDIVSDNVTSHALDIQNHGEDKARRPVFFFEPDAHEQMIKHLEEGWDVFGARKKDVPGMLAEDGTKKPTLLEKGGLLIGSHHIDTETGTPYVVIKHYLPSTEESFTNSTSFFPMSKIQKTLKDLFTTDPTLFIVGSTHSHPGGLPVPSTADINGHNIYQNPYNLSVIHAPRTVRDSSGAFIHGEDASNYLRNNASQTTRSAPVPAPYTRGPKGHYPYVGIGPQIYGEGDNTAFFSGFSYEPPTNFGVTRQTGSFSPVTHGFDDWRRISFPNNVQFISRSGGPSTRSLRSTENFPAKIDHAPSLDPNDEESHTPEFWGLSAQPKSVFGDVTEITPRSLSSIRTIKSQSLFPFAIWSNSVQKSISDDFRLFLETIGVPDSTIDAVEERRRLDAKRKEHYITPGSDRQIEPSPYTNPKDGNEWIRHMEKKITKMADLGIIAPWTRDQAPQKTINTTDHPEFAKGTYDLSDFMRVDPWGRAFVFVNHVIPDGPRKGESVKIPYYHSSGNGGKTNPEIKGYVKPGSWAPYFGVDPGDGYVLKTANIDNDYSSAILRKYGQSLNTGLGQIFPVGKGKKSVTDITRHLWNTKPEMAENIHNFYYWEFQEYPNTPEGHEPRKYWETRIPSISASAKHINSEIDRISPSNWSLNPGNLASGIHMNPILRAIHGPGNFDDVDADKYTGTRREETEEDFDKQQQEKSASLKSMRSKPFPFAIWPQGLGK